MKTFWLCAAAIGALSLATAPAYAQTAPTEASLQPNYGTWGFDASGENKAIKPGDDFGAFANGTYIANLKIPATRPATAPSTSCATCPKRACTPS